MATTSAEMHYREPSYIDYRYNPAFGTLALRNTSDDKYQNSTSSDYNIWNSEDLMISRNFGKYTSDLSEGLSESMIAKTPLKSQQSLVFEASKVRNDAYLYLSMKVRDLILSLTKEQLLSYEGLIKKLVSFISINDISLVATQDSEIQIFKKINNGYISLIVDEYGGITYLVMGKKGFGYKCEYFEYEKIDERNLHILSNSFATVSL